MINYNIKIKKMGENIKKGSIVAVSNASYYNRGYKGRIGEVTKIFFTDTIGGKRKRSARVLFKGDSEAWFYTEELTLAKREDLKPQDYPYIAVINYGSEVTLQGFGSIEEAVNSEKYGYDWFLAKPIRYNITIKIEDE